MPYRYQRIDQQRFSVETGYYHTFGIHCRRAGAQWALVADVLDISTDGDFISLLAARFTHEQLSPLHLLDAILDAIE